MKKFFYSVWRFLKEKIALTQVFFQLKMDGLRLQFAIYMANALQKARNKRFYIIENAQGKLIWLCNDDIKEMKKPKKVRKLINGKLREFKVHMISPKATHLDIMRDCLYYTQESWNNKNGITVEERNKKTKKWLAYMERVRMDRIFGKLKLK
jgi:hypothetical protein